MRSLISRAFKRAGEKLWWLFLTILGGGALSAGFQWWPAVGVFVLLLAVVIAYECLMVRAEEKASTTDEPKPFKIPTLLDLFHSDFSNLTKSANEITCSKSDGSVVGKFRYAVLFDFAAHSKFIMCYIGRSDFTYQLCEAIAQHYEYILKEVDGTRIISKHPGDSSEVESRQLEFTKVVYVYHEDSLSLPQKGDLSRVFEGKNLRVQFRGQEYVTTRMLQENAAAVSTPLKPRIRVSAGRDVEGSIVLHDSRGRSFFRGAIDLIGTEPLKKLEARLVAFARDGERIPLEERPRLRFAPGLDDQPKTVSAGVTEYVDMVCVYPFEGDDVATFCIFSPPASMPLDQYFCLKSVHEMEVVFTGEMEPKKFHFTFKWGLKPETCEFSVIEIPMEESKIAQLKYLE